VQHRALGSLEVSVVGLGCNNFGMKLDASGARRVVRTALDAGVTFFDTSDVYGDGASEEMLGAAVRDVRARVVLATKFGARIGGGKAEGGASARWIERAVEGSLRRLGTDYIDLYQLHTPDPTVPLEETLTALTALVHAGKVREIGCSNFDAELLEEADTLSATGKVARFASLQNQLSLVHRDDLDDVLPLCERLGIGFVPYFPLASGLLTGKYRRSEPPPEGARLTTLPKLAGEVLTDENFDAVERLASYADEHGRTLLELAMAWLAAFSVIPSIIAGATQPEQVIANVAGIEWTLSDVQRDEVTKLAAGLVEAA